MSELGNEIRTQNDGEEAEKQHGNQGAAPKGKMLQIPWRQQHPTGHKEGITRETTILDKKLRDCLILHRFHQSWT